MAGEDARGTDDRSPLGPRRIDLLEHYADGPFRADADGMGAPYLELAPLELSRRGHDRSLMPENIRTGTEMLYEENEPGDWVLPGLVRAVYRFEDALPDRLVADIDDAFTAFDFEFDASRLTENQQMLQYTGAYFAGQRLEGRTFATGETGAAMCERARGNIEHWLAYRLRLGFDEWLSNLYLNTDLNALMTLISFAPDAGLRRRARDVLELGLFDLACHSYEGVFGSTHGRTDSPLQLAPPKEPTRPVAYLLWGHGSLEPRISMSAIGMAASDYRHPAAIRATAEAEGPYTVRSQHNLEVTDESEYGLRPDPDQCLYTPTDVYTRRTPEWLLSCAQDYNKGRYGFQQHIWQATLSDRAVVYTTHPRSAPLKDRPDYWRANGVMPRAVAHGNAVVCLYRSGEGEPDAVHEGVVDPDPESFCDYTHAFVPRFAFDEWTERDGWVCGRVGEGYVGLTATAPLRWAEPRDDALRALRWPDTESDWRPGTCDLIAPGTETAWVCELGRRRRDGDFDAFVEAVADAEVRGDTGTLVYESPHAGTLEFGWDGPLRVDGEETPVGEYPRHESPFCEADLGAGRYTISADGHTLELGKTT